MIESPEGQYGNKEFKVSTEALDDDYHKAASLSAALEALPDIRRTLFLIPGDTMTTAERERLAVVVENIPDFTPDTLNMLGFESPQYVFDAEMTASFRKEDDIETDPEDFSVVRDADDQEWLLKQWDWEWTRRGTTDITQDKGNKLRLLSSAQGEVHASRIADIIGYPSPEAKLVEYSGTPWIAYKYTKNKREVYSPESVPTTNRADQYCRPLFNALLDCDQDGSAQAIIDQDNGTYFAIDLSVGSTMDGNSIEDVEAYFKDILIDRTEKYPRYSYTINLPADEQKEAIREFFEHLEGLTPETALSVFADLIGPQAQKAQRAQGLLTRATAVRNLYESGAFENGMSVPVLQL